MSADRSDRHSTLLLQRGADGYFTNIESHRRREWCDRRAPFPLAAAGDGHVIRTPLPVSQGNPVRINAVADNAVLQEPGMESRLGYSLPSKVARQNCPTQSRRTTALGESSDT